VNKVAGMFWKGRHFHELKLKPLQKKNELLEIKSGLTDKK